MNIDERVYGYEPATSQLAELRAEIERLRGEHQEYVATAMALQNAVAEIERLRAEEHTLREAHFKLCDKDKHTARQIETKDRIISEQHTEIERLRCALEAVTTVEGNIIATDAAKTAEIERLRETYKIDLAETLAEKVKLEVEIERLRGAIVKTFAEGAR